MVAMIDVSIVPDQVRSSRTGLAAKFQRHMSIGRTESQRIVPREGPVTDWNMP